LNFIYALTCIDTVTNFPDAIRLRDKTASHVAQRTVMGVNEKNYPDHNMVTCLQEKQIFSPGKKLLWT
jgi:hypothetical protein